jgi:hypothetical protein
MSMQGLFPGQKKDPTLWDGVNESCSLTKKQVRLAVGGGGARGGLQRRGTRRLAASRRAVWARAALRAAWSAPRARSGDLLCVI